MLRCTIIILERMKRAGLHVLLLLAITWNTLAQSTDQEKVVIPKDDPVLVALDSMAMSRFFLASEFTTDTTLLNKRKWKKDEIPVFDEAHYREAFKKMDRETPFKLVYNKPVKAYIDAYLIKNREKVSRLLGLAELYFPLFEEMLDRYDLPLELKYLAIVESALNPEALTQRLNPADHRPPLAECLNPETLPAA